jgi:hypothetical protein
LASLRDAPMTATDFGYKSVSSITVSLPQKLGAFASDYSPNFVKDFT